MAGLDPAIQAIELQSGMQRIGGIILAESQITFRLGMDGRVRSSPVMTMRAELGKFIKELETRGLRRPESRPRLRRRNHRPWSI